MTLLERTPEPLCHLVLRVKMGVIIVIVLWRIDDEVILQSDGTAEGSRLTTDEGK